MSESYIPRTPLPFSSLYQCEHEWSLDPWSVECKRPCERERRYCKEHMKDHEDAVDEEKDREAYVKYGDGTCEYDLGEWGFCNQEIPCGHYCAYHQELIEADKNT